MVLHGAREGEKRGCRASLPTRVVVRLTNSPPRTFVSDSSLPLQAGYVIKRGGKIKTWKNRYMVRDSHYRRGTTPLHQDTSIRRAACMLAPRAACSRSAPATPTMRPCTLLCDAFSSRCYLACPPVLGFPRPILPYSKSIIRLPTPALSPSRRGHRDTL